MFVLALEAPEIANSVRAGQFVNLGWSPGPLLRRPFSVYKTEGDRIEVILKAVGAGTAQLLAMTARDTIGCLGPLGHGFELTPGTRSVAMGCGTGVCRGCAVPLARGGYDRACKEGPVYRAADIEWSMLPAHLSYAISA